jgi:hypothetical protein
MSEVAATIKVLSDITVKKEAALTRILAVCENQQTVFSSPPSPERAEFMAGLGKEKQRLIDIVIEYDGVFQSIFKTIAERLEDESAANMPAIGALQARIRAVSRLDAKIRAREEATRAFAAAVSGKATAGSRRTAVPIGKVAEIYKKHGKDKPAETSPAPRRFS